MIRTGSPAVLQPDHSPQGVHQFLDFANGALGDWGVHWVVWEHRQYAANNAEKHNLGCYFYGTEGAARSPTLESGAARST
jgi:hypothetical protein